MTGYCLYINPQILLKSQKIFLIQLKIKTPGYSIGMVWPSIHTILMNACPILNLRSLEKYGLMLEQSLQWQRAVDWYRRGLEMDLLAERFYQRLMYCYEQLDQISDAVEVYRQCLRVLKSGLDVNPSTATRKIYQRLRM
ncbi:MAG: bacterial transcriptional activator domain-containing protein, partial [Gammaproteobacteria bacterium]